MEEGKQDNCVGVQAIFMVRQAGAKLRCKICVIFTRSKVAAFGGLVL